MGLVFGSLTSNSSTTTMPEPAALAVRAPRRQPGASSWASPACTCAGAACGSDHRQPTGPRSSTLGGHDRCLSASTAFSPPPATSPTHLGLVRAQAGIGHLALDRPGASGPVFTLASKIAAGNSTCLDLLTLHVEHIHFHGVCPCFLRGYCLRVSFRTTTLPLPPGTAPWTPMRLRSASTITTFKF